MIDREARERLALLEAKVAELYRRVGAAEPDFAGDAGAVDDASAAEDPRVLAHARDGRTIEAIKVYRELTGTGLKEAKQAVERLEQLHRPTG